MMAGSRSRRARYASSCCLVATIDRRPRERAASECSFSVWYSTRAVEKPRIDAASQRYA